ncbi:unnamed protein product [Lepeophtheirus salmonis]|uniref:(salmon louse) hypothetical protein n=1 Tax=Lepeophtheirus salmonis TaxID=72036 RepID=A0A7R8CHL5_LEPSM|nr:unnamed protein product [Lepeophtheirus salmonis]CAF2825066.1 unnamed protein product [Lepeophtheirus salmonis]
MNPVQKKWGHTKSTGDSLILVLDNTNQYSVEVTDQSAINEDPSFEIIGVFHSEDNGIQGDLEGLDELRTSSNEFNVIHEVIASENETTIILIDDINSISSIVIIQDPIPDLNNNVEDQSFDAVSQQLANLDINSQSREEESEQIERPIGEDYSENEVELNNSLYIISSDNLSFEIIVVEDRSDNELECLDYQEEKLNSYGML